MTATLRDLLNIIFRFKRALVIFWLVAILAIAVYYTQTVRKYDSKARILVSLGAENEGRGADYLNNKNMQLLQREQQIHNEQQILLSQHVLLTTAKWILGEPTPGETAPRMDADILEARRFLTGEAPEPTLLLKSLKAVGNGVKAIAKALPWGHKGPKIPESTTLATTLSKSLDAKTIFNSDALDVSFRYRDPKIAQTVLKLVLAAYMQHHIAVFQSAGESDLLKSELDHSVDQYQKRLDEMATFMANNHVFAEDSQINSLIEQRQKISQALTDAGADRNAATANIATFNGLNSSLKRYETYSTVETHNKIHDELISRLNEAQVQEQQILNGHPTESRVYQDQAEVLRKIRELLATQPAQINDQKEERRSGASELVEQQLISSSAAQKSAEARQAQFQQELNRVNGAINDYARNLPGYDMIKLNLSFSKEASEKMGQAYLDSRLRILTAQNSITDISIIDAPSWEPDTASPKKSMVLLLAIALLAMGSVAVVLVGVAVDQTVNDRAATEAALHAPVAAVLPLVATEDGEAPILLEPKTENEFARIYMSVREIRKPGTVILLAGSNGNEGLSLISEELARFLERKASARAAILDCTEHSFESHRDQTNPALLSLPSQESEGSTVDLLSKWRDEFSHIIIATNAAKDIYRLIDVLPEVSAAFLVVEAGRTRRATAISTLDLLRSYGVRSVQIILNKRVFFVPDWIVRRI